MSWINKGNVYETSSFCMCRSKVWGGYGELSQTLGHDLSQSEPCKATVRRDFWSVCIISEYHKRTRSI